MVGKEVVRYSRNINELWQGGGIFAPLGPKGFFERRPHLGPGGIPNRQASDVVMRLTNILQSLLGIEFFNVVHFYSFVFNCASFAAINARISADISSSSSHCIL